jgi:hypothetical protein
MLQRALVLIGVSQTGGNLPKLESIASSLGQMIAWATEQQFQRIIVYSDVPLPDVDTSNPALSIKVGAQVRISEISDTIKKLDQSPVPPEQLIVYFNGHGFRSNSIGDIWLLSNALEQAYEAVNVYASVLAAYHGSFNHVVLVTDACRVPPETSQFGGVTGSSIFVNKNFDGPSKLVDQFFAATVGTPALEVLIDGKPCSIYTLQLSEFLRGSKPDLLEALRVHDAFPKVLKPLALKGALATAVRARLKKNNYTENTKPDAIITSDPTVWLSTFDKDPPPPPEVVPPDHMQIDVSGDFTFESAGSGNGGEEPSSPAPSAEAEALILSASELTQSNLQAAIRAPTSANQEPFWIPDGVHFETSCGVWVDGADLKEVVCAGQVYAYPGTQQHIALNRPELALITFMDEAGLMIPMYPGHIAFLKIVNYELHAIAYEPSANYGDGYETQELRRSKFDQKADSIRSLRDALGSAASSGDLRSAVLTPDQMAKAIDIARYSEEDVDPMLLVLLGYACAASGRQEVLPELIELCIADSDFVPFDLVLLASIGQKVKGRWTERVLPPFPLAAQGWPLLSIAGVDIPKQLKGLKHELKPSSWTLLSPSGVQMCRAYREGLDRGQMEAAGAS